MITKHIAKSPTTNPEEIKQMADDTISFQEAAKAALDMANQFKFLATLYKFLSSGADVEKAIEDMKASREAMLSEYQAEARKKKDDLLLLNNKLLMASEKLEDVQAAYDSFVSTTNAEMAALKDKKIALENSMNDELKVAKEKKVAEIEAAIAKEMERYEAAKAKADAEEKRLAKAEKTINDLKGKL